MTAIGHHAGASRRPLGQTGLMPTRLGVGCGTLVTSDGEEAARTMLEACWANGLRYFDTAPLYGGSEAILGRFLAQFDRAEFMVSTKIGRLPAPAGERCFAFDRGAFERSFEQSLARLKLDRIDILAVHDLAPATLGQNFDAARQQLIDESFDLLLAWKRSGLVGSIALATYDASTALDLLKVAPFDSVVSVSAYTLLDQAAAPKLIPYCERHGIGFLVASPFNSGLLVTGAVHGARFNYGEAPTEVVARTERLSALCTRYNVPLPAAALQFPLRSPNVAGLIVGQRNPDELEANLAWLDFAIPEAFWDALDASGLVEVVSTKPVFAGRH